MGGRYRITAPIGGGGSAAVFAAQDVRLRRLVAVKILHPALAADEAFLERFEAEAQVAAALRHPNVLLVHDWGDDGGSPFLVTELLEGGSLKDMLDSGFRATPAQALQLGLEACRGLDHAHRRGLVHRDVKPANLLFDDEARLRITDFGLARAIAEAATTEPLGAVLGTARYASPEQVEGRPLDGRSDVYSLALVLVEAITGQVPFAADTSAATLLARLERPLDPPAASGPLAAALAAAGRTDRDGRSDAATFARMLKAAATRLDRPAPLPLVGLSRGAWVEHPTAHPAPAPPEPPGRDVDPDDGGGGEDDPALATGPVAPVFAPPSSEPVPAYTGAPAHPLPVSAIPGPPPPPPPGGALAGYSVDQQPGPPVDLEAPVPRKRRRGRLVLLLALLLVVAGLTAAAAVLKPWRSTVDVPQIVGLSRDEAAARLEAEDLKIKVEGRTPNETIEADRIVSSRPARQQQGKEVTVVLSAGPEERTLPAVAGQPAEEVVKNLSVVGVVVTQNPVDSETVPIGTTLSMEPPPGTKVPRGASVTITVSAGPPAKPVPDVKGKSADAATAALQAVGLKVTRAEVFDDRVAAGRVVSTSPPAQSPVRPGADVAVTVSKGPDVVTVPALVGKTPQAAQQSLSSAGLVASTTYGPPDGEVFDSDPRAGAKVKRGTPVALYTR